MNRLYLNVPYNEKESVKKRGARWDSKLKKWYCFSDDLNRAENYFPFRKWIMDNKSECIIATEDLYIVESKRICWKCKKMTTVISLGVSSYIGLEEDEELYIKEYSYKINETAKKPIQLAWAENEEEIPPLLLYFLKKKYNVKTGYSSVAGKYFANHCEYCDSIQGTWYLFSEPDSPFPMIGMPPQPYEERISNLKIYNISIYDDLTLNWHIYEDFEITQYKWMNIHNDFLLDGQNSVYGYKELYCT